MRGRRKSNDVIGRLKLFIQDLEWKKVSLFVLLYISKLLFGLYIYRDFTTLRKYPRKNPVLFFP